jgi:hypothetical protein
MATDQDHEGARGRGGSAARTPRRAPDWADGLKQLYDSVVEEDLPDSFKALLDRLDQLGEGAAPGGSAARHARPVTRPDDQR